jgi:hypothetical protein
MNMTRTGSKFATVAAWGSCLGLLAACLAPPALAVDFGRERVSRDAQQVANWIVEAEDNHADDGRLLPFAMLDKKDARVFVFQADGILLGASPALLGLGHGDTALPGLGARELSAIAPKDRVTQAGRFIAEIGADSHGADVLWLDYEGALAMHRVISANPKERRLHRLATPTPLDNRISWGCINLPVKFYEKVVQPAFTGTRGIVYVLPETRPPLAFFTSLDAGQHGRKQLVNKLPLNLEIGGY